MGYGLKMCECVPPQHGMIPDVERCHVEEQLFGPVVFWRAEYHIKFNFPRASCFSNGDNASKGCTDLLDAALVHLHFIECAFVDEVQSAAAIHEHFGEAKTIHNWV